MTPQDDLKEQTFQESVTLLSFITARGIAAELPDPKLMALFDLSPEERLDVPLAQIMRLRQSLSKAVAPALPETILRMEEWKAVRAGILARVAPLPALLFLIIGTLILIFLVGFGLSAHSNVPLPERYYEAAVKVYDGTSKVILKENDETAPYFQPVVEYLQGKCRFSDQELALADDGFKPEDTNAEFEIALRSIRSDCLALKVPLLLRMFLFFGALGMLGAAYSSIYDSFNYVREGRYDMRLASTYYVRILLGGFSGVLMAEPLSAFLDQGVFSSVLLAFLGGFSAQLVYDLLTKLVDSVANMFRTDRRKEMRQIQAQAELNAQKAVQDEAATTRTALANALDEVQTEPDPKVRAEKMQSVILHLLSGTDGSESATNQADKAGELAAGVQSTSLLLELSGHATDILPDTDGATAADVARARAELTTAWDGLGDAPSEASTKAVSDALAKAKAHDLASKTVSDGVAQLGAALNGDALRAVAKSGLAAGSVLNASQMTRWRYVAYGATATSVSLLDDLKAEDIAPRFSPASGAQVDMADLLAHLRAGDADGYFADNEAEFDSRGDFDQMISGWLDVVARQTFESEIALLRSAVDFTLSDTEFVAALGMVSGNPTARGGLQRLELLGSCVTKCKDSQKTLVQILALADAAARQGGAS